MEKQWTKLSSFLHQRQLVTVGGGGGGGGIVQTPHPCCLNNSRHIPGRHYKQQCMCSPRKGNTLLRMNGADVMLLTAGQQR